MNEPTTQLSIFILSVSTGVLFEGAFSLGVSLKELWLLDTFEGQCLSEITDVFLYVKIKLLRTSPIIGQRK